MSVRHDDDGNVILTQKEYDYLIDLSDRFEAVMESLPVDFKDMYPDWGEDEEEDDESLT